MYRHSPTRNQRSKGFRLKHVLQICVLVAVCFWLIYQVKHSHDKRKQFDENTAKNSLNVEDNSVIFKLGRKDIIPQEKGRSKDSESHDGELEEDDNEEGNLEQDKRVERSKAEAKHEEETMEEDKPEEEESEENDRHEEANEKEEEHEEESGEEDMREDETGEEDKHEEENVAEDHVEEEQEEEIQAEEKDKGRGDQDNEVNQHETEKDDTVVDKEEESIDEEKEKEDPVKVGTEERNDEDKNTLTRNDPLIEDQVHDEGSRNTREAREEQYKGDDASSAVTHDAQSTNTENENSSSGSQINKLENESKGNSMEENKNDTVVNFPEVEAAGNGTSALDEKNKPEVYDSVSQSNSSLDSITGFKSNDQQGSINNTDNNGSSVKNEMEINMSNLSHAHDAIERDMTTTNGSNIQTIFLNQAINSTVTLQNTQVNSNLSNSNASKTVEGNSEESTDSSMKSEFDNSTKVEGSNVLAESKDGSDSLALEETTNEVNNENPDNIKGTDGTYENSDSSNTENTDEVQYDSSENSDISISVEAKENRVDLETLPEIRTEGSNSEEVAEDG
ncbi:uncharacterized protein LOC141665639 [Apium graveolens]|uniref:uncharacterized protein LOC141665639 n=1 Tax=Apium graveolens TaxID=4045 RepID=UPI003D7B3766